jgi:hypothetical protein
MSRQAALVVFTVTWIVGPNVTSVLLAEFVNGFLDKPERKQIGKN